MTDPTPASEVATPPENYEHAVARDEFVERYKVPAPEWWRRETYGGKFDGSEYVVAAAVAEELFDKWWSANKELSTAQSALAEAQKKAAMLDSRRVVGWVRGVEFIGLPEHVKPGDRPIFTLEGL